MAELEIYDYILFEELPSCRICNLDKDKILIICLVSALDEIRDIVTKLPSIRSKIMLQMNNPKNMEHVENEKIPISKFLWDMYIVALHQYEDEASLFKPADIAKYERDRFVARKIIIQYEHIEELKEKFTRVLFPERVLDRFSIIDNQENEEVLDYEAIELLIKNIEDVLKKEG